jgi:hypothetical protein
MELADIMAMLLLVLLWLYSRRALEILAAVLISMSRFGSEQVLELHGLQRMTPEDVSNQVL